MTTDHASLINMLRSVRTDIAARGLISDGTAIGMGLANAVSRLKDSKAKSKVVILLTDGSNNMGDISPLTSAQIAKSFTASASVSPINRVGTFSLLQNSYVKARLFMTIFTQVALSLVDLKVTNAWNKQHSCLLNYYKKER